ncbi:hypothetical protein [Streptomyces sp. NPDC002588]|uniref:hypothetical protein n=1 Tax=Streptomyces sp. NPDC002588 TaxID=3154419 RepID=UPI00332A950E
MYDPTRLELITEAVRAALEEDKNPTKPKTRILATGNDAVRLLEHLYRHGADRASGPRIQALRQIMVQNHHRDAAGHLRRRTRGRRPAG